MNARLRVVIADDERPARSFLAALLRSFDDVLIVAEAESGTEAVAAIERFKGAAIVVDFGTATTFDCISPKGEYLGGVIVPGVQVSLEGLLSRAAVLARIVGVLAGRSARA